jgi:hypothetical protein
MKGDPRTVIQVNTKYGENWVVKVILLFTKYCWHDQIEEDIALACSTPCVLVTAYEV